MSGITLPIPLELTLDSFTLYRNKRTLDVAFDREVFCLAGANGLGKSTFLNTLNFAITGVVADPRRKFDSLAEYLRFTAPYASEYYDGRIGPDDRNVATVKLRMIVGEKTYTIERGFFGGSGVRSLTVRKGDALVVEHNSAASDADRDELYRKMVSKDAGLARFEQLIFLQHFLVSFDEQHRLLLWDERTIEQTLMLAFGVDPDRAAQVDVWRRSAERAESQARNLQYQATTAMQRLSELKRRVSANAEDEANLEPQANFEELERQRANLLESSDGARRREEAAAVELASAEADLVATEQAYELSFLALMHVVPGRHPLVVTSRQDDVCGVCGQSHARDRIDRRVQEGHCWLCDAEVPKSTDLDESQLDRRDAALAEARKRTQSMRKRQEQLRDWRIRTSRDLADFDEAHDIKAVTRSAPGMGAAVAELERQYQAEAEDARRRRDEYRERRDHFRSLITPVARELSRLFSEANELFVPEFTALAHAFLGLDVDVYLSQRGGRPSLVVAVEGTERRSFEQLSESQRYFIDIALRMALVSHMTRGESPGCLFIDTPEGSLDISYEARVGKMFGAFAEAGNRIVMTANINTSRLLTSLADVCGPDGMKVVPMTDWTRLSDVQAEGEHLFLEAFEDLLHRLEER